MFLGVAVSPGVPILQDHPYRHKSSSPVKDLVAEAPRTQIKDITENSINEFKTTLDRTEENLSKSFSSM